MAHKKSIRFRGDHQVRAVWDEVRSKWWFSAIDIIRAINDEEDYVKAGNYWRWLKRKLTGEGIQLVSVTHDFKFEAPDGKQRASDALDTECVQTLAKNYPNNRANAFLDDSLVVTSCMLPEKDKEIDFCVILTRDKQFNKTYSKLDPDVKGVLDSVCHAIPIMKNIEAFSTSRGGKVNLCNSTAKNISEIWPPIILDLIKSKNSDAFAGETYKFGNNEDSAKCVFFKTQREDNTLQKSSGLCFITPGLSETIIKSVDEKDFFMNNGVIIPSLPHVLQNGNEVSFMPKDREGDDIGPIRK